MKTGTKLTTIGLGVTIIGGVIGVITDVIPWFGPAGDPPVLEINSVSNRESDDKGTIIAVVATNTGGSAAAITGARFTIESYSIQLMSGGMLSSFTHDVRFPIGNPQSLKGRTFDAPFTHEIDASDADKFDLAVGTASARSPAVHDYQVKMRLKYGSGNLTDASKSLRVRLLASR